jgi:hypothetical protein
MMDGGGEAGGASGGDKKDNAGARASFRHDQHGQPGIYIPEARAMDGGGRAGGDRERDGARSRTWIDSHGTRYHSAFA